jgi:hypothetical protein
MRGMVLSAFPLDLLGFDGYAFPVGERRESMSFLDPLEGTEIRYIWTIFRIVGVYS